MKWIKMLGILGIVGLSARASAAGSVTGAQITELYISSSSNMIFIGTNVAKTNSPSCSAYNTGTNEFVLPLTTTLDNQMLALLISARATQTPVTLTGNGLCDTYGDAETLAQIIY